MMGLATGLVKALIEKSSEEAIDNVLKFSLQLHGEFAIMLVKDMQQNGIDVEGSNQWGPWVREFTYL